MPKSDDIELIDEEDLIEFEVDEPTLLLPALRECKTRSEAREVIKKYCEEVELELCELELTHEEKLIFDRLK